MKTCAVEAGRGEGQEETGYSSLKSLFLFSLRATLLFSSWVINEANVADLGFVFCLFVFPRSFHHSAMKI